jgi:hypothetical protein
VGPKKIKRTNTYKDIVWVINEPNIMEIPGMSVILRPCVRSEAGMASYAIYRMADSGGKTYYLNKMPNGSFDVRRKTDTWTMNGEPLIGNVLTLEEAISLVKADSGSQQVNLRDPR